MHSTFIPKIHMQIPKLLFLVSVLLATLTACSSSQQGVTDVVILKQGQHLDSRPEMAMVCEGFSVKESEVQGFIALSTKIESDSTHPIILPCYASGSALIDGQKFQWNIHLGGIAEFYNDQHSFFKVCGIKCCDKIKGIC